jgi:hypothetical protein
MAFLFDNILVLHDQSNATEYGDIVGANLSCREPKEGSGGVR